MKRILILFAALIALAIFSAPVRADDAITITSNTFTNNFPRQLVFQLEVHSAAKITDIALIAQIEGQPSSSRQIPEFTSDTKVQATYKWDLQRNYLPPGVTGQYWWTIQDSAGNQLQTPKQPFQVDDPTHQWKKLANDKLALYWYAGGDSFGKALFDRGVEAMKLLQQDTGVTVDRQVLIWIYGNRSDFFRSMEPGASEWTGGRTYSNYSIVLINVELSALEWGKSATTHEMTHVIIHQKIRGPLGDLSLPHWMDEGLAVYYEAPPGTLDSQFSIPLRRAIQSDSLVPVRTLSGNFPADSDAANLAYGESWSVVDFIFRHYGRDKMAQLLQAFKTGGFYDDIFRQVLGVDTDGLENEWRKDVGLKPRAIATRSAAQPSAFPTFSLSTDLTPSAGAATATPPPVAVNVTPAAAPTSAPQSPANPISTFCGGVFGSIALGIFGTAWWQRNRKLRA